ncbi:MAG: metallophosphoesterase family protein [Moorea sp. SIO3I7]|uniref:purple acid phosphatase family protein n=1 Tax=Moorena sp. SIO3I8 TaxID=2607833 RepID=UPI0013C139FA|nr:metallophosphoesterase family protein [Moorena sp. SIO3I8]NEN96560.1 metallophosphoesterase family protein [Moorena sp. SIO3I7]NEO07515.1 metallophosphoesterase family protein [Moorena sp. SIO3I8]
MVKFSISRFILMAAIVIGVIVLVPTIKQITQQPAMTSAYELLTDPFLQFPTEDSVRVVWFTEFPGSHHTVTYGTTSCRKATATTTKLSRTREDQKSRVGKQTEDAQLYQNPIMRDIWRHEAIVTGLTPGVRVPYQVSSVKDNGQVFTSKLFSLSALPNPQTPQKILLTSDHQLMPMTAANLQKVVETVGQIDGVFYVGDLVNIPDRASEWFDDNRGGAFFPCLQGRANYQLEKNGVKTTYHGGEIIQNAPIFTVVGNHEVMGRFSMEKDLNSQFNDPFTRAAAQAIYQQKAEQLNPDNDPNYYQAWLKNNTYNTDTYNEIFYLPNGQPYYAVTFGDIRLVVLYITNIWRTPSLSPNAKGRYQEREQDLDNPIAWGYGQHIFEPVSKGSPQYQWLQAELNSTEFQQAKYKIVMFHHPPHSLGGNIVPAYTNPVQIIERDRAGKVTAVRYEYPKDKDYIIQDVVPLLEAAGVQLVYYGHSHLWNRFVDGNGMHFLESSNVGNSYGAHVGENKRPVPTGYKENYSATGDPNGLEPVMPTIEPLLGENNQPLPYIASNDVTVFSILDTGTGIVTSYRFDTRSPNSDVIKFDQFQLRLRD